MIVSDGDRGPNQRFGDLPCTPTPVPRSQAGRSWVEFAWRSTGCCSRVAKPLGERLLRHFPFRGLGRKKVPEIPPSQGSV